MKRVVMVVVALALSMPAAFAARTGLHDAAESPQYGRKFGGMIGRGAINATTGFVDVLSNIVNESRNGPPLVGTLVGVGKGVGCGVLRTLSGGVDLVSFWVPNFNGFPVSSDYTSCFDTASPSSSEPPHTWHSTEPLSDEHVTTPGSPASGAATPKQDEKPRWSK